MSRWQPQQPHPEGPRRAGPSPRARAPVRPAAPPASSPRRVGGGARRRGRRGRRGGRGAEELEARPAPAARARPRPAPRPALPAPRSAPPPPYQGFGYVPPLRDVFAVLLVSHPDPLFGHHGLGSRKNSGLPPARTPRVSRRRGRARPLGPGAAGGKARPPASRRPLPTPRRAGSGERPEPGRK